MIHIGNQTSCWAASMMAPFEYAIARRFEAFEWFPDKKKGAGWDAGDLDAAARQRIREAVASHGLRLSVHAHWSPEGLVPSYAEDMALARDLGAVLLNIHLSLERGMEAFIEGIKPLIEETANSGLLLAIENTPHHAPEDFNALFAGLRALRSMNIAHVGMCLDLGHANLCAATRDDYLRFVDRLDASTPIIHLHLHENWGDSDSHLPLFTGPSSRDDSGILGLADRLTKRAYSGSVILEQWPSPPELLDQARDRLIRLFGQPLAAVSGGPAASIKPGSDFEVRLIDGDRRCRSWREKLELALEMMMQEAASNQLTVEKLAAIAVYLRFLGSGEIACSEDGRHFRPCHHSGIASRIRQVLARDAGNEYIIRQILPWLPSSAGEFHRAEPLTRIRDIAHRNDIPHDLKAEIKHTLQNKLHRCAGPEDLIVSRRLLERIIAPNAGYSSDFVAQFKIFHGELENFFNARPLLARLSALSETAGADLKKAIDMVLMQPELPGLRGRVEALSRLTRLRQVLCGTPHDNADRDCADIGLEDRAFSLLSETVNLLEAGPSDGHWGEFFDLMLLSLNNLICSGVESEECRAIRSELAVWRSDFEPANRECMLRLKACVDRIQRLADTFSRQILNCFLEPAQRLGTSLGVPAPAISVFCEAEIRRHVVFQLSKLASMAVRRIRSALQLPAWSLLSLGSVSGRVQCARTLGDACRFRSEAILCVLEHADGDEEIPSCVEGLILAHDIPHLSHLGVRARQKGILFAVCEDPAALEEWRQLEGRRVTARTLEDQVVWTDADAACSVRGTKVAIPNEPFSFAQPGLDLMPLSHATIESSGGKGWGASLLDQLSKRPGSGFLTPPGVVVPFGVMEAVISAAPKIEAEWLEFLSSADSYSETSLIEHSERMRKRVLSLPFPSELVAKVRSQFEARAPLMVRSSANCEDLDAMAGAGLYDSVANVSAEGLADAIKTVWASLWTRRAVMSRKQAGISHRKARMAVLIQQCLQPDYSFIVHTVNPSSLNANEIYAEIAVGLGETLASANAPGNPYRIVCDKKSGYAKILAFANFSASLIPAKDHGLNRLILDYSTIGLSRDFEQLRALGEKLAAISNTVENAFRRPQDIEGVVAGGVLYLVQARVQQGLPGPGEGAP